MVIMNISIPNLSDLFVHLPTGYWQGKKKGKLLTFVEYLPVSDVEVYICFLCNSHNALLSPFFRWGKFVSWWLRETSRGPIFKSKVLSAPVITTYCRSFVKKYYLPYCAHLCMKCFLSICNFLEEISSLPILLSSSNSLHCSLKKAFLFLLTIHWNSAFRWVYLFFCPLPLASLLFSAICKASSNNHFAFLHFFFLGMVLITATCTMLQTSVHSSSGTLSDLIPWIFFN